MPFSFCPKNNNVVVDWASPRGNVGAEAEAEECGVYMTNIKEDVEDQAVRDHFGKFGVIEKVKALELELEKQATAAWFQYSWAAGRARRWRLGAHTAFGERANSL